MTNTMPSSFAESQTQADWVAVCSAEDVPRERGVAALVGHVPVAIFRLSDDSGDDSWHCVDHIDPATGVPVMARGLVGSTGADHRPTVAAPLHKQRYDLETGECLDQDDLVLGVHRCWVADGLVYAELC